MMDSNKIVQAFDPNANRNAWVGLDATPPNLAVPNDTGTVTSQIVINSNPGSAWNSQYADEYGVADPAYWDPSWQRFYRAMTIVHELAHIWATAHNLHNGFELADSGNPDQEKTNHDKIYNSCFK